MKFSMNQKLSRKFRESVPAVLIILCTLTPVYTDQFFHHVSMPRGKHPPHRRHQIAKGQTSFRPQPTSGGLLPSAVQPLPDQPPSQGQTGSDQPPLTGPTASVDQPPSGISSPDQLPERPSSQVPSPPTAESPSVLEPDVPGESAFGDLGPPVVVTTTDKSRNPVYNIWEFAKVVGPKLPPAVTQPTLETFPRIPGSPEPKTSPCTWAIINCCAAKDRRRRDLCFLSHYCGGIWFDQDPCSKELQQIVLSAISF